MRREKARVPIWKQKALQVLPLAQVSEGWTEFPKLFLFPKLNTVSQSVPGDVNKCVKAKIKGGGAKKVWKILLLIVLMWKFTLHVCILKVLRTPVVKEPVWLHLIQYFPSLLTTDPSVLTHSEASYAVVFCRLSAWETQGYKNCQRHPLHSTSCFSYCSLPACLPSAVDSDQPKHLNLVLSWTGSLKTASGLCNPS